VGNVKESTDPILERMHFMKNVFLLTIDTLRRDVLGCYGGGGLTPFIDSIQNRCIRFDQAHSTGPYTRAAFPGILTSSYYLEYGKQKILSGKRVLISEVLKKAGIVTAAFHSNPYVSAYFGWDRGWDVFYDSMEEDVDDMVPYIKADKINRKVDTWLSSHLTGGKDSPFFLWMHYMDVHEPYIPERKYIDLIDPSIRLSKEEMFSLFKEALLKRDASNPETVEVLKKLYCAHIREADEAVKEFFEILKKRDILKDSWIILTTDHGDEFGEHRGLSHDGKMYSELIHVPLMIYEPAREKGEVCDTLVSTLDVSPTIAHLFGLKPVEGFGGHSLLPLIDYPIKGVYGEAVDKHGSQEKGEEKEVHYYREGDLKIIYREKDDSWELYDLRSDPTESNNIVETSPEAGSLKEKVRPRVRRFKG
jgi:arylsulfatase A-like enzyme